MTASQYPTLANYTGLPTVGTIWFKQPDGTTISITVYFDNTVVYAEPTENISLPAGTTFNFTQLLILVS